MGIKLPAILGLVTAAALLIPSISQAQTCNEGAAALFLNVDGTDITGEHPCTTLDRTDSILVLGLGSSSIVTPPGPSLPTFAGFNPVTFVKPQDKSTPLLYQALATIQPVQSAEFRFYSTAGGPAVHTYTLTLQNAFISSISSAVGTGDGEPTEAVSIAFATATWTDVVSGVEYNWSSAP